MLGKVTRWLRMLGQDVTYSNHLGDSELLKIAKSEERILLTRDFELYQRALRRGIEAFYLQGTTGEEKLAELAERYGVKLEIDMLTSRCPRCNSPVMPVLKERIVGRVEKCTLDHYKDFWECTNCGQIYWQGAHWKKISKTLGKGKEILEKIEKKS